MIGLGGGQRRRCKDFLSFLRDMVRSIAGFLLCSVISMKLRIMIECSLRQVLKTEGEVR